jgi:hypothetical protein
MGRGRSWQIAARDEAAARTLDNYMRSWGHLDIDLSSYDVDWKSELGPDAARVLREFATIETDSVFQMANAISAGIGNDPVLSDFLPKWAAEEAEHGRVLGAIVNATDGPALNGHLTHGVRASHRSWSVQSLPSRCSRPLISLARLGVGDLSPHYSAFGAIQEWSVVVLYQLLAERVQSDAFTAIIQKIVRQERRHFAVYFTQARARMADDPHVQKQVRRTLELFWSPVGMRALGSNTWHESMLYLCPTVHERRQLRDIDKVAGRLPGLSDVCLMDGAVNCV